MDGLIKRKQALEKAVSQAPFYFSQEVICPLCQRQIPKSQQDAHHLIPKTRGGIDTVLLHRLCHRQIHALFMPTQLAINYATIEALSTHPEIIRFIEWVKNKPTDLNTSIRPSRDKGRR